jgi:hypothetical protein
MRYIAVFSRPGGRLTIDGPGDGQPFTRLRVTTTEIVAEIGSGDEFTLAKITEQGIKVQGLVFEEFEQEVLGETAAAAAPKPAAPAPVKAKATAKPKAAAKAKGKPGPKPKAPTAAAAPAKPKGKPGPKPGSHRKPKADPAAANVAGASAAAADQQLDTAPAPDQAEEDLLRAIAEGADPQPVEEAEPAREEAAEGDPDPETLTEAQLEAATRPTNL